MFILLTVKDTIPVPAAASAIPGKITIMDALNKKYSNKLIPDKGLALSAFDILSAEEGKVTWGNGLMYYKVSFRLLLFAPFHSEIMVGRVLEITRQYIRLSVDFFRDIYIPVDLLMPNMAFDEKHSEFFFYFPPDPSESGSAQGSGSGSGSGSDEDPPPLSQQELLNTPIHARLYISVGVACRFRVNSIEWQDIRPDPPSVQAGAGAGPAAAAAHTTVNGHGHANGDGKGGAGAEAEGKTPYERAPYRIIGSLAESGMGVPAWW